MPPRLPTRRDSPARMDAWRDLRALPRPIWVLFAATLVNRVGTMAVPFLALYLIRHLAYSAAEAGAILALYGLAALLTGPVAGRFSDRLGPMGIIKGSFLASGSLFVVFPLVQHPVGIIAIVVALGVAGEAFRPALMSVVADLTPVAQHRQAYALLRLAANLGMSIGPAVGGFLALVSFPAIFVADGVTTLLAGGVLIASRIRPERPVRVPTEGAGKPRGDFRIALGDRRLQGFLLGLLCAEIVSFQAMSSMPVYMVRDLGLAESVYGLVFTLNTCIIVAIEIPLTATFAAGNPRRPLVAGALLYALGFGAIGLVGGLWTMMGTVVIWTFGEMLISPTASAYVASVAPPDKRGAYMGVFAATYSLAFILGPWLGMLSLDALGPSLHWAAVFAFGCIATGLMYFGVRGPQPA